MLRYLRKNHRHQWLLAEQLELAVAELVAERMLCCVRGAIESRSTHLNAVDHMLEQLYGLV